MNIDSKYNPKAIEDKWYEYWMQNDFFSSKPDEREANVESSVQRLNPNVLSYSH